MRRWLSMTGAVALVAALLIVLPSTPAGAVAPTNDDFADAAALPGTENGSVTGSTLEATAETGENADNRYVWYSWQAPSSGTYLFDACGTEFGGWAEVYTGTSVTDLTDEVTLWTNCYLGQGELWTGGGQISATAGDTFMIAVGSNDGGVGEYTLNWYKESAPGNDAFGAATALSSTTSGEVAGTTRFATADTGQPSASDPAFSLDLYNSVWFYWDAPATGQYLFDTCTGYLDSKLGIYTGTAVDGLTEVATGDDDCGWPSQALLDATSGQRYYIAVSGYYSDHSDQADFTLQWHDDTAPANDAYASATALSSTASGSVTAGNWFATLEAPEIGYSGIASVWWTWTAPASGPVVFDTCTSGVPTWLAAYTGSALADAVRVAGPSQQGCMTTTVGATLAFSATMGETYRIRVTSDAVYGGEFTLRWESGSAPANDAYANATELSGPGGWAWADNRFASLDATEPTFLNGQALWWTWTAPDADPVTFDTCGSKLFGTRIGVYTGTLATLTTVATGYNGSCGSYQARVQFAPTPGMTYHIGVGGTAGSVGDLVLHWPESAPAGDALPAVTTNPTSTSVAAGATAEFSAAASGQPTPTVQWERSTNGGSTWSPISGATSTTYTTEATTSAMNGYQYRAVFTNTYGSATTSAATLTVWFAPVVTTNPVSHSVQSGTGTTFTAAASGNPTPTVQWERSTDSGGTWSEISGATSTTLTLSSTTTAMNGYQYRAKFSNSQASNVTTTAAVLTVTPSPATVTGLAATVSKGKVTVTFTGSGDPMPTYFQCMLNVKRAPTWVSCSSGDVFKSPAKSVSVRASRDGTTWGDPVTVTVTR